MVFQNYALWPHMTVAKNVAYGLEVRRIGSRERQQRVAELLQTVRIADKASAKPMELSGGQQQRVALARALAVRPSCLLLDEPLSNLDAALRAAMRWEIRRIVKQTGTTGIYVTHDQAEALAIADRIALMREGKLVQVGSGRELYESPNSRFVAEFLGEANFLSGKVASVHADAIRIETAAGILLARRPAVPAMEHGHPLTTGSDQATQVGAAVTCCIRPEGVRLFSLPGEAQTTVKGTLTEWTHLGESARFKVALHAGAELSGAAMPARELAGAGKEVTVYLSAQDVAILPQ
jgi:iron(III) transport system ATP-binding protein